MGLFGSRGGRKGQRQAQRREPRLFATPRGDQRSERAPRRRRSLLARLVSFALALSIWGFVVAGLGFGYIWTSLDRKGLLHIPDREPGIMLLASDGSVLAERGSFFGDEVRVDELPDYVTQALIAIEDRRFRSHFGVDPIGLIRAMVENARAGGVVQGGSTLTQQLAKNLFLTPERTFERKAQEMVLAIWLESHFTKDEILQLYLNRVYYGAGATGIEKAARKYFGKSARDVSLPEAAILAAVLKAPSAYNPLAHPNEAEARAREVIASMVDAGFISAAEARRIADAPATVKPSDYLPATQYIVDWTVDLLPELVRGYKQSIVVETTLDPGFQSLAEKVLRRRLNEEGVKLGVSQGAAVLMDLSGAIKAMVGGKSYVKSQFNRVTQAKRQPGSAFKPFVFLTALEQGYSPNSTEVDEPVKIGDWEPENYKHKYLGTVTLTKALALSLNTVAAKLAQRVSPQAVVATAHRLGIASALGSDASIALGTSEVTLLELTSAFAPFANGGAPVVPYAVQRVSTRDGQVLYQRRGDGLGQAVASGDVGAMNRMMRAVVTQGTARRAQFGGFDIGGKTGTSQDYRDAWFIGYTSHLIAGVWVGNDDNSPTRQVTGGSLPTTIWKDIMEPAHAGLVPAPLPGSDKDVAVERLALDPDNGPAVAAQPRQRRVEPENGGLLRRLFGRKPKPQPAAQRRKSSSAFERQKQRARDR